MTPLLTEWQRFTARRIVRGTFVLAVLIVVVAVSSNAARGHPARRSFYRAPAVSTVEPGSEPLPPQVGYTVDEGDSRIDVGKNLSGTLVGTGIALLLLGFVLGASFVGSEFNGASLSTQLLFEPRRGRVHAAKAVAVGIGVGGFALAILVLVALSMLVASEVHGIVHGVDATFWRLRTGQALRISAAVALGAVMTYTVALVTRRTSASVIAFLLQFPLISLVQHGPFRWVSHYAPVQALLTMMLNPARFADLAVRPIHTIAGAVVLTCVWASALLLASGGLFSRAEVR